RIQSSNGVRELSIGDHEGGDVSRMKHFHKLIYLRVHDRFANQRQGTVACTHRLFESFLLDAWHTFEFVDHAIMSFESAFKYQFRIVKVPFPHCSKRISMMTPTENTLVGTGQAWSCFHAAVAFNAIKRIFVTSTCGWKK